MSITGFACTYSVVGPMIGQDNPLDRRAVPNRIDVRFTLKDDGISLKI